MRLGPAHPRARSAAAGGRRGLLGEPTGIRFLIAPDADVWLDLELLDHEVWPPAPTCRSARLLRPAEIAEHWRPQRPDRPFVLAWRPPEPASCVRAKSAD